jgi:hypothetical protein
MRFQPYFSDWFARLYLSGQWLLILVAAALAVGLFSWVVRNDDQQRAPAAFNAQADCKSGAGCCRPRVQDTEDPKIECNDDDWRKP